jgi:hypothetical protein
MKTITLRHLLTGKELIYGTDEKGHGLFLKEADSTYTQLMGTQQTPTFRTVKALRYYVGRHYGMHGYRLVGSDFGQASVKRLTATERQQIKGILDMSDKYDPATMMVRADGSLYAKTSQDKTFKPAEGWYLGDAREFLAKRIRFENER